MKTYSAVLAGALVLLATAPPLPAQSTSDTGPEILPPPAVNLDLPPQVVPDPAQLQEQALAAQAIQSPDSFHEWLLQLHPERSAAEDLEAFAILLPDAYARAHPKSPDEIRAEAIAAQAILNPHFPLNVGPN